MYWVWIEFSDVYIQFWSDSESSRNTYKPDYTTDERLHIDCSKKSWFIIQKLYIYKYIDSFFYSKPMSLYV